MDVSGVKGNIKAIYARRASAVYALCLHYAAMAIEYFLSQQPASPNSKGAFWTNRTAQAAARMFARGFREDLNEEDAILGWFMAHGVQYGTYLELANNRAHESIRPIVQRFAGRFFEDVKKIYGEV
jgi:hypothetical protein